MKEEGNDRSWLSSAHERKFGWNPLKGGKYKTFHVIKGINMKLHFIRL